MSSQNGILIPNTLVTKKKEKKKNYPIDLSLIKSEKQVIVISFHNNRASPWKSPELQALFLFHK